MTATIKEVGTSTSCRLRHGTRFFRSFSLLCDNKDHFRQQRKKYEQVNRSHEKDKGLADLLLAVGWKLDVPLSGTCKLWRGTFTVGTIYCGRLQIRTPQRVWPRTRTLACVTPFRLRHKVFSALMQLKLTFVVTVLKNMPPVVLVLWFWLAGAAYLEHSSGQPFNHCSN